MTLVASGLGGTVSESPGGGSTVRIAVPAIEDVCAMTIVIPKRRELARRVSGGVEVALYWSADDNTTSIEVWQAETGETVLFAVASEHALDAFYHPFAHLPTTTADLIPDR